MACTLYIHVNIFHLLSCGVSFELEGTELERLESNELEQKFYLSRSEIPGFLAEVEFTGDSKAHKIFNFL